MFTWENSTKVLEEGIAYEIPENRDYSFLYGKDLWNKIKDCDINMTPTNVSVMDFAKCIKEVLKIMVNATSGILRDGLVARVITNKEAGLILDLEGGNITLVFGKKHMSVNKYMDCTSVIAGIKKSLFVLLPEGIKSVYVELGSIYLSDFENEGYKFPMTGLYSYFDGSIRVLYADCTPGMYDIDLPKEVIPKKYLDTHRTVSDWSDTVGMSVNLLQAVTKLINANWLKYNNRVLIHSDTNGDILIENNATTLLDNVIDKYDNDLGRIVANYNTVKGNRYLLDLMENLLVLLSEQYSVSSVRINITTKPLVMKVLENENNTVDIWFC